MELKLLDFVVKSNHHCDLTRQMSWQLLWQIIFFFEVALCFPVIYCQNYFKKDPTCTWIVRTGEACKLASWVLRALSRSTFLFKWLTTFVLCCPAVSTSAMSLKFFVSLELFLNWPRKVVYHLKAGLTSCCIFEGFLLSQFSWVSNQYNDALKSILAMREWETEGNGIPW